MSEKKSQIYKFVTDNVNIYFRPMLDDVILERPGNMRDFMLSWMKSKGVVRRPQGVKQENVLNDTKMS
jgi:hypothetical protein